MLADWSPRGLGPFDVQVFDLCVPADHFLRRALAAVNWEGFLQKLTPFYSPRQGRPAELPVLMLKLEYLRFQYQLSDRGVVARAETDMAFRLFLQIGVSEPLPDPSTLCYFRGRLGPEGFQAVFHDVVAQAREAGLVKDRLRIKDATHVIADIAVPTTLALVAQVRDKLLKAARPFDPVRVSGEQANVLLLHESLAGQKAEEKLEARVTHLREILAWVDKLPEPADGGEKSWADLVKARQLAHKILADQENPQAGDRTRSVVDPEARRGKHGGWYDGYLLDVLVDADSELITAVNVLPGNGDEAADAAELIRQEETAHGNDVKELSIDSVAFQGPVLRELQDPQGLGLEVIVPPKQEKPAENFRPQEFTEDDQGGLTCPAGQRTTRRSRNSRNTSWIYHFPAGVCGACPLREACLEKPAARTGRSVYINDYQAEYERAREKAATPHYQAIRREHPKVERKLGEIVKRHGGRRAQRRGQQRILSQQFMACTAANIKRIMRLLFAPQATPAVG